MWTNSPQPTSYEGRRKKMLVGLGKREREKNKFGRNRLVGMYYWRNGTEDESRRETGLLKDDTSLITIK